MKEQKNFSASGNEQGIVVTREFGKCCGRRKTRGLQKGAWLGFAMALCCTLLFSVRASAGDVTMQNKKWVSGQRYSYADVNKDGELEEQDNGIGCYKIKITKPGYIRVEVKTSPIPGAKGYVSRGTSVRVLDSRKKEIYDDPNVYAEKRDFDVALKKGIYYLEIDTNKKYQIRYTFTATGKIKGKKPAVIASKASLLPAGKTVKGVLYWDSYVPYYKIKVPKKKKVTISFNCKINGEMKLQILAFKGKELRSINKKGKMDGKDSVNWWDVWEKGKHKVSVKLAEGTYYIRLLDFSGRGQYYTMKWK
jgi:hypothetical protein